METLNAKQILSLRMLYTNLMAFILTSQQVKNNRRKSLVTSAFRTSSVKSLVLFPPSEHAERGRTRGLQTTLHPTSANGLQQVFGKGVSETGQMENFET